MFQLPLTAAASCFTDTVFFKKSNKRKAQYNNLILQIALRTQIVTTQVYVQVVYKIGTSVLGEQLCMTKSGYNKSITVIEDETGRN